MKAVWKYPVPITDVFAMQVPVSAQILSFQVQFEQPCLWALVDTEQPTERREFRLAGTGHPIEELGRYIGSAQMMGGGLVWHLFETTPIKLTISAPTMHVRGTS